MHWSTAPTGPVILVPGHARPRPTAGGKSGSDYVIGSRFAETIDYAKVCGYVLPRQHLGRHAERVADRKTVQGAAGTLDGRAHAASEARTVSTSVTSIIGL